MNRIHKYRILYVSLFALGLALSATLIFYALKQNINVFITPSEIIKTHFSPDYHFRLGGMVKKNSILHEKGLGIRFTVTDLKQEITVRYTGVLPDLFREGKGMIAFGTLSKQGEFMATQILAKHDENYMPKKYTTMVKT
ncbi:MAG: cytochrome c biogenesis protein CcmE [Gammaproteobacteria bacterium RIFCSPHIGHO2_12_FULL_38_14]|nr:MAG: cytochrome c biogenesis protein CcmE [Gammaproteobacteria bacterium RIFCSPHIGHO2_12_FULL_38_14]